MSLTPEDGSGVAGADTYATVAEFKTYANKRGLTVPAADADIEKALVLACDFMESLRWKGQSVEGDGPLMWPREGVTLDSGTEIAADEIPNILKNGQCQLAAESAAGTELQPSGTGREVVREKIDVLEVQYAQTGNGSVTPQFNKAIAIFAPLLETGGAFGISVDRA